MFHLFQLIQNYLENIETLGSHEHHSIFFELINFIILYCFTCNQLLAMILLTALIMAPVVMTANVNATMDTTEATAQVN